MVKNDFTWVWNVAALLHAGAIIRQFLIFKLRQKGDDFNLSAVVLRSVVTAVTARGYLFQTRNAKPDSPPGATAKPSASTVGSDQGFSQSHNLLLWSNSITRPMFRVCNSFSPHFVLTKSKWLCSYSSKLLDWRHYNSRLWMIPLTRNQSLSWIVYKNYSFPYKWGHAL